MALKLCTSARQGDNAISQNYFNTYKYSPTLSNILELCDISDSRNTVLLSNDISGTEMCLRVQPILYIFHLMSVCVCYDN